MKRYFEIVDLKTCEVVQTVDVTGKSERDRDRIERGMLMRVDRERFFVRERTEEE